MPPAVVAGSLNHWTTREAPKAVVEPHNSYALPIGIVFGRWWSLRNLTLCLVGEHSGGGSG